MPSLPSASILASCRRYMTSRYSVAEELRARLDDLADLVRDLVGEDEVAEAVLRRFEL